MGLLGLLALPLLLRLSLRLWALLGLLLGCLLALLLLLLLLQLLLMVLHLLLSVLLDMDLALLNLTLQHPGKVHDLLGGLLVFVALGRRALNLIPETFEAGNVFCLLFLAQDCKLSNLVRLEQVCQRRGRLRLLSPWCHRRLLLLWLALALGLGGQLSLGGIHGRPVVRLGTFPWLQTTVERVSGTGSASGGRVGRDVFVPSIGKSGGWICD